MFRLLNKSAIWHLCQCVNHSLWNSSKWPFTGAVLQSASRCNTRVPWADQGGWSVSQFVVSNFSRYSGAQLTWATRIPSSGQR